MSTLAHLPGRRMLRKGKEPIDQTLGTQHSWQPGDPVIDVDMYKGPTDRMDSLADGSLASACQSGTSEVLRRSR